MDSKMRHLWSLLFFFLTADLFVHIKTVSLRQSSVEPGVIATKLTAATSTLWDFNAKADMILAQEVQYSMNLNGSGSAALDSAVLFEAELIPNMTDSGTFSSSSDSFIYLWMNMASKQVVRMVDGLNSSITITFSSGNVKPGEYLMAVAAYLKDDPATIVASGTRKFLLTEKLNGLLIITQNLNYQRDPNIFSSKKSVTLTAKIHDQFLQSGLTYEYYWCQGQKCSAHTTLPSYAVTIFDAVNVSLASLVYIYSKSPKTSFPDTLSVQNNSSSNAETDAAKTGSSSAGSWQLENDTVMTRAGNQDNMGENLLLMVQGIFQRTVTFKDEINECIVKRVDSNPEDRGISMKETALVNVSCVGSAPSSICTNITSLNEELPSNRTCKPELFYNKLHHQVRIQLTSTGWNDVHFLVYNDISRYHLIVSFYGYNPDSVNVPALTLPIVFGVLGIIIIIIGGVYIMRLRKKPLVEVADFDFHPSLTSSQSQHRFNFSRVASTIRCMFSRDQYETNHTSPLMRKPTSYSNDLSESLYESL